ncbi:MAG: lipocalin family protein [Emcibacter sp.]|nr:lipocalin family protein [Emcibacter sp.]
MKIIGLIFSVIGLAACSSGSSNFSELETVPYVDLKKYTGEWFEIARIDHWFQKGCVNSKATYIIRDDGDIDVINQCWIGSEQGKMKEAKGRAWVVDKKSQSKLKVQFPLSAIKLPFLAGNYWIIALDEDYQYVMIGEESRKYLWILSRNKPLPAEILESLVEKAKVLGFPVEELIYQDF